MKDVLVISRWTPELLEALRSRNLLTYICPVGHLNIVVYPRAGEDDKEHYLEVSDLIEAHGCVVLETLDRVPRGSIRHI